jgi:hypothetical protein
MSNTTTTANPNTNASVSVFIADLIKRQNDWNIGSRHISKQELYGILAGCLDMAHAVKRNSLYTQLDTELTARGFTFNAKTSTITKIVRCVFGTDKRELAAYAGVLKIASKEGIAPENLVAWINGYGGIRKTRAAFAKPKTTTMSSAEFVQLAKNNLSAASTLAVVNKSNIVNVNLDSTSGFVVTIARINGNGDCEVLATTNDSAAVRDALVSWGKYVKENNLTATQESQLRDQISNLSAAVAA